MSSCVLEMTESMNILNTATRSVKTYVCAFSLPHSIEASIEG